MGDLVNDRKDGALRLETGRSLSKAGRQAYSKVVTPGWEDIGQGMASPGVGGPLWRDIQKDGSRARSFGSASRFPKDRGGQTPGPGLYKQTERDVAIIVKEPHGETKGS